ncbi:2-dehydropantoate 2-reductase [Alteromonas sp. 345S023]|uniref:2-dehydropantoate 2-reductase n=1 Tax=Alteromonas profundi TaxID=2696062 RepID=A0A7X5RJS8_9ALTE|nr:2-dehydropantoate 2-reductase [Alteromonas profundi]NDV89986.1 2-dehydropantoate 2-reductase [Alteromonas profundi]
MKQCIVGSGLIGSFLGSVIALNGGDIKFVARGEWLARLQQPLTLTDYKGHKANVPAANIHSPNVTEKYDVIWLTVKCTALKDMANVLSPLLHPRSIIICCQNGVGSHHIMLRAFPHHQVLRAMVPFNVVVQGQHLHKGSQGELVIEDSGDKTLNQRLLSTVRHNLLEAHISDDIEPVQWAKLQLNLGNGVNALADMPVKAMLQQRPYRRVIASLMDELLNVTGAAGIALPKVANIHGRWIPRVLRLPNGLFTLLAKQMLAIDPSVKTSMWWDLNNGKTTEKTFLYGAVVSKAEELNVAVPYNRAIISLLREAEEQGNKQHRYRALSPETLEARVREQM